MDNQTEFRSRSKNYLKPVIWQRNPYLLSLIIMIFLLLLIAIFQPSYLLPGNLAIKLRVWMPLILVSFGQTLVILGGGIDLSVGAMIALINVISVQVFGLVGINLQGVLIAIIAGTLVGILAGLVNGFCVSYLRLQPIVTTFATSIIWQGIALWVMKESGGNVPMEVYDIYSGNLLFLPLSLWVIIVIVGIYLLFKSTRYFMHLKASGGNISGSFETGLSVARIRMWSYVFCGLFTSLAALCIISETITGNPLAGEGYALQSISAVVIGGTSLAGGFGGAIGSIIGAIIMKLINDVIFFLGIPVNFQKLMQGLIIIAALAFGGFFIKKGKKYED